MQGYIQSEFQTKCRSSVCVVGWGGGIVYRCDSCGEGRAHRPQLNVIVRFHFLSEIRGDTNKSLLSDIRQQSSNSKPKQINMCCAYGAHASRRHSSERLCCQLILINRRKLFCLRPSGLEKGLSCICSKAIWVMLRRASKRLGNLCVKSQQKGQESIFN